mmetsp:Transcript_87002/g.249503  ORF Transcript_87002/g.249503 Transcript_87002/m.249503 type:complete len:85 (+) Transcript_87002:90-344(+)
MQGHHPIIAPYEPAARRGELPGSLEAATPTERYMENMKKSPLPVTWHGVAGAVVGTLVAGPYGGVVGVGAGIYLERKWRKEQTQ